jgi:transcriptional regulator with XRE-family HTH domain
MLWVQKTDVGAMRNKRKLNSTDTMIARRIKLFRINAGLSQTELGDQIGVTFQQIQKYEKGANRVGAGRLSDIAKALGISVHALFPESSDALADTKSLPLPTELLAESYALQALQAFVAIQDKPLRQAIVQLLERLAANKAGVELLSIR